jgi:hypothetical protein
MEKKKIGTLCAEFYKSWSEFERKYDESLADVIVRKVAHFPSHRQLRDSHAWLQGIKRGAQPKELLLAIVSAEKKRKKPPSSGSGSGSGSRSGSGEVQYDDGEVVIEKVLSPPLISSPSTQSLTRLLCSASLTEVAKNQFL